MELEASPPKHKNKKNTAHAANKDQNTLSGYWTGAWRNTDIVVTPQMISLLVVEHGGEFGLDASHGANAAAALEWRTF
jgi:hypothetical protein